MKIEVDIPDLKETGRSLKSAAREVEQIQSSLKRAMSRLTLESRRRSDVDSNFQIIDQYLNELQEELHELSNFSSKKSEQFEETDAYGQKSESGGWWNVFKRVTSLVLDFCPIIGNAKGLIEAVTGRDLITGDKLAPWERALNVLGPAGKFVNKAAKVTKVLEKGAEGVNFIAKTSDDGAGVVRAVKNTAEVVQDTKAVQRATEVTTEVTKEAKHVDEVIQGAKHVDEVTQGAKHVDEVTQAAEAATHADTAAKVTTGVATVTGVTGGIYAAHKQGEKAARAVEGAAETEHQMNKAKEAVSSGGKSHATSSPRETQHLDSRSNSESWKADPIHMGTGDQLMEHTALKLYGAAEWPVILKYHSNLLPKSEMGVAWTHNYAMRLELGEETPEGKRLSLTLYWNAAQHNLFTLQPDGSYRSLDMDVQWDTLYPTPEGYTLIRRDPRDQYLFTEEGQLEKHINPEGYILQIHHEPHGKVSELVDQATGRSLQFSYNTQGLLTRIEDSERSVQLKYNEPQHLIAITDPTGYVTEMTCEPEGRILTLAVDGEIQFHNTYDEQHRIIAQTDAAGHTFYIAYDTESRPGCVLTTLTDAQGHRTRLVHDEHHLLLEIEAPDGIRKNYTYNEQGQETRCLYSDGREELRFYDDQGRLIQYIDPRGNSAIYRYNEQNQLIEQLDAEGHRTEYQYDEQHRLVRVVRADGSYSETTYNDQGLRASYRDFNGAKMEFHYHPTGELAGWEDPEGRRTKVELDASGRITAMEDALGYRTVRLYDGKDNLIQEQDALGNTWSYTYDASDLLLRREDPSGAPTVYTYTPTGKIQTQTDALQHTTRYEYDEGDRLVVKIDPEGNRTRLTYDEGDRLLSIIDPLERVTQYRYDAAGRLQSVIDGEGRIVQQLTYDASGNPLTLENGLGHRTQYRFNALHQVTEETDGIGRTTRFKYDAVGRMIEVIEADQAVYQQEYDGEGRVTAYVDANRNRTELSYDASGRLIRERNAAGSAVCYEYDARGLLFRRLNAKQQSTEYRYDGAGRVTGIQDEVGEVTFQYDENGRMTRAEEGDTELTRSYDAVGRLTSSTDTLGYTLQYEYDAMDRLTKLHYPDGKVVQYRYNEAGELAEVKDWRGRLTRYRYDSSGKLIETTRPNGTRETRTYDQAGQLIRSRDQTRQGVVLQQYRYTYNEIGQMVQEEGKEYTYDQLRRLSSGAFKGRVVRYSYDLGGNLTESQDTDKGPVQFSYTQDNRLQAIGDYPVEMDAEGNLLYQSNGESMGAYEYDARNRLVKTGKARYTYNVLGTRTKLSWKGKTTQYVVDEQSELSRVLMELDETGTPIAYYVYGLGLIGREDAAGRYVSYHSDYRGSTTLLTDETGRVTDRYTYGIYGELEEHEGQTSQPFCYNGRDGVMTDPNGLYYMRARYYEPELKRFLNRDVLRGELADGQTYNRYGYVNGDPVRYVDPLGLCKAEGTGKSGADNIANYSKLKEQLKNEEFTSLFKNGSLHPDVLSKSVPIIPGEQLKDANVIKALTKDGSSMSDWAKMESPTYSSPYGDFKFHFYKNLKTGEVSPFDNKMKMNGYDKSYIYPKQMYP